MDAVIRKRARDMEYGVDTSEDMPVAQEKRRRGDDFHPAYAAVVGPRDEGTSGCAEYLLFGSRRCRDIRLDRGSVDQNFGLRAASG